MTERGILTIRPLAHGLTGTFEIDDLKVPVVASRNRAGALALSGPFLAGELHSKAGRIVGDVLHLGIVYALDGAWELDDRGQVLCCAEVPA